MSAAVTSITRTGADTRIKAIERAGGVMYVYERLRSVGRPYTPGRWTLAGARAWCVERIEVFTVAGAA